MFKDFFDLNVEIKTAFTIAIVLCILNVIINSRRYKFPPGPIGLPVVGYLPFLTKDVHLKFCELSEKHGKIFSVRLGSVNVVVLNDIESIKEAFSKPEFLARPPHTTFTIFNDKSPFVVGGVKIWQEQRRFMVNSLKDLGLGRTKLEGQIQEEINNFLNVLKSYNGEPVYVVEPLTTSLSNNICALLFSQRFEYSNPERIMLDANLAQMCRIIGQTKSHVFFPWMRHFRLLLKWWKYADGVRAFNITLSFIRNRIEEHKKILDPKNIRDFVDGYLIEMKKRQEQDPSTTFNEAALEGSLGDIMGASSESVRTSVSWLLYTVAAYPDVKKKIQQEICEILDKNRCPEYLDHRKMPYTFACIMEIMRWKTIVPINVPRSTTADTTVKGFDIPRGTTVLANFWAVLHDPKHWVDPDDFKPERFLDADGKTIKKPKSYIPFSVGKRACPGESMTYMEVFLYFVSILQHFDVRHPDGIKPTFEAELTVSYSLKPFLIHFIPRKC